MTIEAKNSMEMEKKRETIRQVNNKVIRKKNCKRIKAHLLRVGKPSMSLQNLFVACKDVFQGPGTVPPPHDVQKLQDILDTMKPEDVGLSSDLMFFQPRNVSKGTPSIAYTTVYQCKNFSICIFFLPPTAVIPLHNHPEMTVFNRLLLGSAHIKSYDWVDPSISDDQTLSSALRLARMKANHVFTASCNTSVLYPTSGGNIHAFTAQTACAILDVIGPPYSKEDGRDCTYYRDFPYSSSNDTTPESEGNSEEATYGWLQEIDVPKDLKMDRIEYMGPQIVESRY